MLAALSQLLYCAVLTSTNLHVALAVKILACAEHAVHAVMRCVGFMSCVCMPVMRLAEDTRF